MKLIKLRGINCLYSFVDDENFDFLNSYKWRLSFRGGNFYAARSQWVDGKPTIFYMHRVIASVNERKEIVDHVDGNGLNNLSNNLRVCSNAENVRNSRKVRTNSSSIYKGVSKRIKMNGKPCATYWTAQIREDKKTKHIGNFKTEQEAALMYNKIAVMKHGEFANINIIKN